MAIAIEDDVLRRNVLLQCYDNKKVLRGNRTAVMDIFDRIDTSFHAQIYPLKVGNAHISLSTYKIALEFVPHSCKVCFDYRCDR